MIPILWRAQQQAGGWLPQKAIEAVAELLGMANIRVLEVATFYTMFNLEPVGRFHVQLCGTTPCMLRGSEELKNVLRRVIGEEHHVSTDGTFSWIEVECLGACVNAPMVQINADYYEDLTPETFDPYPQRPGGGQDAEARSADRSPVLRPGRRPSTLTDPSLYAKKPGEAANVHEAAAPKPPIADATDPGRH